MTEVKYDQLVKALANYNVALRDANGEFRSAYDVLFDIAAIWGDLSTMEQSVPADSIVDTRKQKVV